MAKILDYPENYRQKRRIKDWVSIPPVPHSSPWWEAEIECRHAILPSNLLRDPDFAVDSPMWDNYHHYHVVLDKRRKAGFLGDKDFNFSRPPRPREGGRG
jgi:hypothetical protein